MASGFETPSVIMRPLLLMTVQAPAEDVERIVAAVTAITPLAMGAYDSNAFVTGSGTEHYRPLEGAAAFELPDDQGLVGEVVEAVFQVHSYQEPVIRLLSILASRSKGHDDRENPNRWWNTTGDWKEPSSV